MNIHYRVVKVDPAAHGIVVRYFTDVVTEMDLASSFNDDGSVKLNSDGYPVSTRTDVLMGIYDTPSPSNEELEKRIMLNAPTDWLKLQEDIKNPSVDTKLSDARNLTGQSKSFTSEELTELKTARNVTEASETRLDRAHQTVITLMDSLKVLSVEDPEMIVSLSEVINDLRKIVEK